MCIRYIYWQLLPRLTRRCVISLLPEGLGSRKIVWLEHSSSRLQQKWTQRACSYKITIFGKGWFGLGNGDIKLIDMLYRYSHINGAVVLNYVTYYTLLTSTDIYLLLVWIMASCVFCLNVKLVNMSNDLNVTLFVSTSITMYRSDLESIHLSLYVVARSWLLWGHVENTGRLVVWFFFYNCFKLTAYWLENSSLNTLRTSPPISVTAPYKFSPTKNRNIITQIINMGK